MPFYKNVTLLRPDTASGRENGKAAPELLLQDALWISVADTDPSLPLRAF